MWTLLVVDDEADIRNGLAKTINWGQCEIGSVLTAGNGKEALEIMKATAVDIVLTDIKMPGMDGLELAREIRRQGFETEIIILSGFAEFSYAQRAMAYDVRGYALKPVDIEECMRLVSRAAAVCREKRCLDQLAYARRKTDIALCEHRLRDAMLGRISLPCEQETAGVAALLQAAYHLVCIAVFARESSNLEMDKVKEAVAQCVPQEIVVITGEYTASVLFMQHKSLKDLRFLLEERFVGMELEYGVRIRVGIGSTLCPISKLAEGYEQACNALNMSYFFPEKRYFQQEDADGRAQGAVLQTAFSGKDLLSQAQLDGVFRELPTSGGTQEQARELVRTYFGELQRYCEDGFLQQRLARQLEEADHQLYHSWNAETDKATLRKLIAEIFATENTEQGAGRDALVGRMKRYIQDHYAKDIDLYTVSEAMMKNSNYLSHLFSDTYGMTFSEYLNTVRVKHSKRILMETEDTVYAIARQVGYNSERYFITKFKELTGLTPTQFRNRK